MLTRAVLIIALPALFLTSCETFNAEIEPPAYIFIEDFTIDNAGVDAKWQIKSSKISDVWLYVDESQFKGAYELPATIPIAEQGRHSISLRAGIKDAGIATKRAIYPFYMEYQIDNFNLIPNHLDTMKPVTKYDFVSGTIVDAWFEDFESLFSSWENNPASDTVLQYVSDSTKVFDGSYSGGIFLGKNDLFYELNSTPPLYDLPKNGTPTYLELNYRCNHEFIVGLYANFKSEQIPIYTVKERAEWNKIYLNLTDYLSQNNDAYNFSVFIGVSRDVSEGDVEIYLDNIKLIHY